MYDNSSHSIRDKFQFVVAPISLPGTWPLNGNLDGPSPAVHVKLFPQGKKRSHREGERWIASCENSSTVAFLHFAERESIGSARNCCSLPCPLLPTRKVAEGGGVGSTLGDVPPVHFWHDFRRQVVTTSGSNSRWVNLFKPVLTNNASLSRPEHVLARRHTAQCYSKAMSGLYLCSFITHSQFAQMYEYSVLSTHPHEYCKVQAREASSVGSCINISDLYKSHFTSTGLYPCLLDVALLCRPMRIRNDREVSQQCASSTMLLIANCPSLWPAVFRCQSFTAGIYTLMKQRRKEEAGPETNKKLGEEKAAKLGESIVGSNAWPTAETENKGKT